MPEPTPVLPSTAHHPGRAGSVAGWLRRFPSLAWGLALITLQSLLVLAAPLLAPHPPNRLYDAAGAGQRPPGTSLIAIERRGGATWLVDEARPHPRGVEILRRGQRTVIPFSQLASQDPEQSFERLSFPLGTDRYGRDLLSRLLYGGRISLSVALISVLLAVTLGVAVGGLAAFGGRLLDGVLMRLVDALLAFPVLFMLITLAALLKPESNWVLILVLAATGWMGVSRLARGAMLGQRQQGYITAARSLGLPRWRIFFFHLLPNSLAPILATTALMVGGVILAESALSFLGLGIQPPQASWGTLISDGRGSLTSSWWISAFPGLAIVVAVLGFNLIGDGLRDLLDPQLSSAGGEDQERSYANLRA